MTFGIAVAFAGMIATLMLTLAPASRLDAAPWPRDGAATDRLSAALRDL